MVQTGQQIDELPAGIRPAAPAGRAAGRRHLAGSGIDPAQPLLPHDGMHHRHRIALQQHRQLAPQRRKVSGLDFRHPLPVKHIRHKSLRQRHLPVGGIFVRPAFERRVDGFLPQCADAADRRRRTGAFQRRLKLHSHPPSAPFPPQTPASRPGCPADRAPRPGGRIPAPPSPRGGSRGGIAA